MCLCDIFSILEKQEWLEKQPDVITGYKVVRIRNRYLRSRLFPFYRDNKSFFNSNYLKRKNRLKRTDYKDLHKIYYFLYVNHKDALGFEKLAKDFGEAVELITCKIPKNLITDIGKQNGGQLVIVSRGYDVVGQDKYLE